MSVRGYRGSMTGNLGTIASAFGKEHAHEVGLAVLVNSDKDGFAYAVVDVERGGVIAWDGWYYGDLPEPSALSPLTEMEEWQDRDTYLSQAVLSRSLAWLQTIGTGLLPVFSLSDLARRVIDSHGPEGAKDIGSGWNAVAYYPLEMTRTEAVKTV